MSFDTLAPFYRTMEAVLAGGKLHRCRIAWLSELKDARHVLLVGEGHGRFLAECARQFPETHFTCVDASAAMLEQARKVWRAAGGKTEQATFIRASLPEWLPPQAAFDVIVTNFFLDCFSPSQLADVISTLTTAAQPGARWLIADFRVPERGWLRLRARLILAAAYTFFRVATRLSASTLTSPDELLRQHGFQLIGRRITEWGLLHADQWRLAEFPSGRK